MCCCDSVGNAIQNISPMMIMYTKNIKVINNVADGNNTMAAQHARVPNNENPASLNIWVGQVKPASLSQSNANQT